MINRHHPIVRAECPLGQYRHRQVATVPEPEPAMLATMWLVRRFRISPAMAAAIAAAIGLGGQHR